MCIFVNVEFDAVATFFRTHRSISMNQSQIFDVSQTVEEKRVPGDSLIELGIWNSVSAEESTFEEEFKRFQNTKKGEKSLQSAVFE